MSPIPFSLRRIGLLARGVFVSRDRPQFSKLAAIEDAESFIWAILPHAARSFAPSILLLPESHARAAAVGYLYARMLDTFEDLSETPATSRAALAEFALRFQTDRPAAPPVTPTPQHSDARDQAHLLLIDSCNLVDEVYLQLDPATRIRIATLVADMSAGMIEFSRTFETQGGVLSDEQQVLDYCHRVIGLPALFVMELLLGDLSGDHQRDALEVSELIQLANITRDIEKDLLRGIAYHPALAPHLRMEGPGIAADVSRARRDLMMLATRRSPAFRRLVDSAGLRRLSPARAAAVMMMLFTDRHYRECAAAAGLPTWSGPRRLTAMVLIALPAAVSPWWADRVLLRAERDLLAAA
jgi:phytoene/squalene synthetase